MGLLESFLGAIVRLLCGPSTQQEQPQAEQELRPPAASYQSQQPQQPPQWQTEQPAESTPISVPPPAKPHYEHPSHPHRVDQNQVNQQNEHYRSLRDRANEEGDAMARCFQESHEAYAGGDGARAKELSNEGKRHQAEMERLNKEASEWIFIENNKDSKANEIDLHGLYVKEAISYTERSIQEAQGRGDTHINFIVGKGLHSRNGAKIKPAIEELMQKYNLVAEVDPSNAGVLIVSLDGQERGAGRVVQPDDLARGIEQPDEGCVVM